MKRTFKVAVITVTMNDGYKLQEWYNHYLEYRDEVYLHIIVDNASTKEYISLVESLFTDSVIIEREMNGGSTQAYNDGIKYALKNKEVQYIALVGNDIKLKKHSLTKCCETLLSDKRLGMVSPVILQKDSMIISDFGHRISKKLTMIPEMYGKPYPSVENTIKETEMVAGGMNVSSRMFYEQIGLQDEKLFMYSDEVDMAIRAKTAGIKMAVVGDAIAWHQHINENKKYNIRHPYSKYLISRNKVYLAQKHFGFLRKVCVASYFIYSAFKQIILNVFKCQFVYIKDAWWQIIGALNGFIGNMHPNKYSHL